MTELDIQDNLFKEFEKLNTFSGITFINDNVAYPNKSFTIPSNKRWFELNVLSDGPEPTAMMSGAPNRYNGFMQVDVCTPLNKGEEEAKNKYEWIFKLFPRGKTIEDITIRKCYIAHREMESDHYRMQVRIEFTADLTI